MDFRFTLENVLSIVPLPITTLLTFRYGVCLDSAVLGGNSESDEYDGKAEQLVFKDNGGFDNKAVLAGGFVLLWTVNRVAPGRVGSEDFINMAVISTDPTKQGWIGIGFSPNGKA